MDVDKAIEQLYKTDWSRIVATLIRLIGDFDLAEECAQEAFSVAIDNWKTSGVPEHPRAWIIQTARHKAIDRIRRRNNFDQKIEAYKMTGFFKEVEEPQYFTDEITDDRLRLIFTCCHPDLALESQVALTLRMLGGLETDEIARAFLVPSTTMAQRIVRAKRKIKDDKIPYQVPDTTELQSRLDGVLNVIYLIFNEGYASTNCEQLIRTDLCLEAIRLGRLLYTLLRPSPPTEVSGLLALLLFHDSRREARTDNNGDLVLLENQDRSKWNHRQIDEAILLINNAGDDVGPFTLQAAIASVHCRAERPENTDWREIIRLYEELESIQASPIISLNKAVAIAMTDGPQAALDVIDKLDLEKYHLYHATKADMYRRLSKFSDAAEAYQLALNLVTNSTEQKFIERRLAEVKNNFRQ